MDPIERIRHEYLAGGMSYIDAIMALDSYGMEPKDAEETVSSWDGGETEPNEPH